MQVVLPVGREGVGLLFREHIQEVVVSLRNLCEKIGVNGGSVRITSVFLTFDTK